MKHCKSHKINFI